MTAPIDTVLHAGRAHVTGGRDGPARSDNGKLDVRLSPPGGAGPGKNPEQLSKTPSPAPERRNMRSTLALLAALSAASPATAQPTTAADVLGPAAVAELQRPQPPARLIVDAPLPGPLAEGKVFIQYRAESLRIQPVFGAAALAVTPRIGHIHVTVDQAPWHWADASGEPIILVGLPPGPHSVEITLADATHRPIESKTVSFVVAATTAPHQH